jgi:hypothetical protein
MTTARRICFTAALALLLINPCAWSASTYQAGSLQIGTVSNNPFTADVVGGAWDISPTANKRETGLIPTLHVARDSQGRVLIKTPTGWAPGRSHREDADFYWTTICDPIAKTMTDIRQEGVYDNQPEATTENGTNLVLHITGKVKITTDETLTSASQPSAFHEFSKPEAKKLEDIGEQTLLGLQAHGYRWWVPVDGAIIESDYNELFQSEELASDLSKLITRGDGPRGRSEVLVELKNLQRVEPDPRLFQIPTGYKIESSSTLK